MLASALKFTSPESSGLFFGLSFEGIFGRSPSVFVGAEVDSFGCAPGLGRGFATVSLPGCPGPSCAERPARRPRAAIETTRTVFIETLPLQMILETQPRDAKEWGVVSGPPPRQRRLREREDDDAQSRGYCDVLLSIQHVSHRAVLEGLAGVEMPERLSVLCARGGEGPVAIAVKDQPAGSRHQTAAQNAAADIRDLPLRFAGLNVDRLEELPASFTRREPRGASVEGFAGLPQLAVFRIDVAGFFREHVEESRSRVVRRGGPVRRA